MSSSVQVADLRKYGVLSSMKRWAWEKMKVWTMVVAAPAVLPPARLPSWMCPVVVGDICEIENVIPCPIATPPPRIR